MTRIDDIMRIADNYGLHHQTLKLLEELHELKDVAILAHTESRYTKELSEGITERLVDEMTDVTIMIRQITYLLGAADEVEQRIDFKINRQLERIAVEVNNEQPDN